MNMLNSYCLHLVFTCISKNNLNKEYIHRYIQLLSHCMNWQTFKEQRVFMSLTKKDIAFSNEIVTVYLQAMFFLQN